MSKQWAVIAAVISAAAAVAGLGPAFFSSCKGGTPSPATTVRGDGNTVGTGDIVVQGDVTGDGLAVGSHNVVNVDRQEQGPAEVPKAPAHAE